MNPFERKSVTRADITSLLRGILTAGIFLLLNPLLGVFLAILFIYAIVSSQPYRPTHLGIEICTWIGGMVSLLVLASFTKPKPIPSRFSPGVEETVRMYFTLSTPTEVEDKPDEGIRQLGEF